MRLRFWRKRDPQWRDLSISPWDCPDGREQECTGRELSVPIGKDSLSVELIVGLADVGVLLHVDAPWWEDLPDRERCASHCWELADVPTEPSSLQLEIAALLPQCECDDALTERVSPVIREELTRLVMNARSERDRRLSLLPNEAGGRENLRVSGRPRSSARQPDR